jgi:hypothetical protein
MKGPALRPTLLQAFNQYAVTAPQYGIQYRRCPVVGIALAVFCDR